MDTEFDRIAAIFRGKTVFLTGASGFVGSLLLERLLSNCREIGKIYLLLRPKCDVTMEIRLKQLLQSSVFDGVRPNLGDLVQKVEIISGDFNARSLAISAENREKLENEVEIIYNCAANVRFDNTLKNAIFTNTRSTKFLVELAKKCHKLKLFCHVSTAYCHLAETRLDEKPYAAPEDPEKIIKLCETLDETMLEILTPRILGNYPNTYSFSKALSEDILLNGEGRDLPLIILRPSIVVPTVKWPVKGWTNNLYGMAGVLTLCGKGAMRSLHCNKNLCGDYIPADLVANALICAPFAFEKFPTQKIYNLTTSKQYKITYKTIFDIGLKLVQTKMPMNHAFYYPAMTLTDSAILYYSIYSLQWLYSFFGDLIRENLYGYKARMVKMQKSVETGQQVYFRYVNNEWDFINDNLFNVIAAMNNYEKRNYLINNSEINYEDYILNCLHGIRLYVFEEGDDTLDEAKSHVNRLWWVDTVGKFIVLPLVLIILAITFLFYYIRMIN